MEERIKQEHEHPHKNGGTTPHKRKNRVMELIVEMWPAYLIEILVIILGIWVTMAFEQWRESRKEMEVEKVYQKNLLADINDDIVSLKYAIDNTQILLDRGNELLNYIDDPGKNPVTTAKADSDIKEILSRPKFMTHDATFSDLKSSGNLRLLKDISLKNLLFSYYSEAEGVKGLQDAEQQTTIVVAGPYFMKHFPLANIGKLALTTQQLQNLVTDVEFGNNLLLRKHNRDELLEGYQKANKLAVELKKELEERAKE